MSCLFAYEGIFFIKRKLKINMFTIQREKFEDDNCTCNDFLLNYKLTPVISGAGTMGKYLVKGILKGNKNIL